MRQPFAHVVLDTAFLDQFALYAAAFFAEDVDPLLVLGHLCLEGFALLALGVQMLHLVAAGSQLAAGCGEFCQGHFCASEAGEAVLLGLEILSVGVRADGFELWAQRFDLLFGFSLLGLDFGQSFLRFGLALLLALQISVNRENLEHFAAQGNPVAVFFDGVLLIVEGLLLLEQVFFLIEALN